MEYRGNLYKLGVLLMGVLIIRALLFGVYVEAPIWTSGTDDNSMMDEALFLPGAPKYPKEWPLSQSMKGLKAIMVGPL